MPRSIVTDVSEDLSGYIFRITFLEVLDSEGPSKYNHLPIDTAYGVASQNAAVKTSNLQRFCSSDSFGSHEHGGHNISANKTTGDRARRRFDK
jgi:hypothetical protein